MRIVIFDFDGTIADSFPTAVDIFYELTGYEKLPKNQLDRLRGLNIRQLSRELGIPLSRLPFLLFKGKKRLQGRIKDVKLFNGVSRVIEAAPKEYKLFILSSNSKTNIIEFLKANGLEGHFSGIIDNIGLFAKAKYLRRLVKDNNASADEVWYVGDEIRDIEAAKKAGVRVASVTWGYNNKASLAKHNPDKLVDTPGELTSCIYDNSKL